MPKPPRNVKVGNFPGSSAEEIENEPVWGIGHNHRIGVRNNQDRFAGFTHEGDHWANDEDRQLAEQAMAKYRELRKEHRKGELLNFKDVMKAQTDLRKHNKEHYPPTWKFVINSTEDFVKYEQDWPANIEAREKKEEQEKQEKEKEKKKKDGQQTKKPHVENENEETSHTDDDASSNHGSDTSHKTQDSSERSSQTSSESDEENNDEDEWRQNRGGEHSDKHHAAYGPGPKAKHDQDADYKRLREKYTPQEIALLRSLQDEKEHIHSLEQNDGTMVSPVQIKDPENHLVGIDIQDTMTPDNWIPRSQNLIRQTGQHPLNAEPKFSDLFAAGLITPNEMHYVRSHGAVPRLYWETHILDINNGKLRLTMDDIRDKFEPINIAMAMGCDGVRRGEMNMIKKSKGFSWGPGAISNAYWKGARLSEVLNLAGFKHDNSKPRVRLYVHFEGADQPSEGKYATSIAFDHAINPQNDVILAYEMNNTKLPPDHGFPLRVVIPGFVGGRCVKWLARIWVSEHENDSHYHIWDNRVLPSFVTEKDGEFANTMFRHPDTACYEQNLNSIIARPAQDEKLDPAEIMKEETYRVEGIAYDGGGHMVQRVEISLDEGETWLYAVRKFPERPVRHGNKYWTWCFWHVDVDSMHFTRAKSIVVRAFNVFKNTQPAKPIWNVMGMMNNCWYRVKPAIDSDSKHLIWQHPIDPEGDGGWMKPSTENQLAAAKQNSGVPDKQFTRTEIERHSKKDDCWLVINGNVYDATSVLSWHPGGPATIIANGGKLSADVTSSFESIHDEYAHKKLQECAIGKLSEKAAKFIQEQAKQDSNNGDPMASKTVLKTKRWTPVILTGRDKISEDTFKYSFEYRDKSKSLGLGTCQHIQFGLHMLDKMLVRQYTPTRPILENEDDGTFELVLKTYFPDENQPGGAFSVMLSELDIGEEVQVSGPSGEITYHGNGKFDIEGNTTSFARVNLILGGSGITPGYQLLERILRSEGDKTEIRVVDANKTEADILLRDEMEELQKKYPDQFKITHVLSHPVDENSWKGDKGHVNEEIIKKACFEPDGKTACFLCGPPTMIQKAAVPALTDWGFKEDDNLYGF